MKYFTQAKVSEPIPNILLTTDKMFSNSNKLSLFKFISIDIFVERYTIETIV
jgi:hypothetical protein